MNILKKASLLIFLSLICLMSLPSIATASGGYIHPDEFDIVIVSGGNNPIEAPSESLGVKQTETTEKSGGDGIQRACDIRLKRKWSNGDPDLIEVTKIPYMSSFPTVVQTIPNWLINIYGEISISYNNLVPNNEAVDMAIYRVKIRRGSYMRLYTAYIIHDCSGGSPKLDVHSEGSFINNVSIFPTPCRTHQNIAYSLNKDAHVNISIFDMKGRLHTVVSDAYQEEGFYALNVDTSPLPPGIYFYKIRIGDMRSERKFVKME